jgi:hypothetical protein
LALSPFGRYGNNILNDGMVLFGSRCIPLPRTVTFKTILLFKKEYMAEQQAPNQLNIEISEEMAEGTYANLAIITHSHAEFVIDFVNVMPGTPKSRVKSRIIFTPMHAKRFMRALEDNVQRYEALNGKIQDLEQIELPLNFGGPTAQA